MAHLIAGLIEDHDRSKFEVYAISASPDDGSALRRRLERGVDRFIDVRSMGDDAVAVLIRELEIDIAVDLNGLTKGGRLGIFARRPAPIQATYLGFSGTTGCTFFDYVLVDPVVVPADQQPFYTETLLPFGECFLPSDAHREPVVERTTRQACGLPEKALVFCSFNSPHKITAAIFDVWMKLLREIPDSVLWLVEGSQGTTENLKREAAERGVDESRLVFAAKRPSMSDHLARYRVADLFLDTFPYNAATTASDALSMGLPVLTLSGKSYASRMAGSLLRAIGLDEMITTTVADYEALARTLATEPDRLAAVRARLDRNIRGSRLFDADRHRKSLEAAYIAMVNQRQAASAIPSA